MEDKKQGWRCPKCNSHRPEVDEISTTGGLLSRWFNLQSKKFATLSCTRCHYTEFYKTPSSKLGNIVDFLGG